MLEFAGYEYYMDKLGKLHFRSSNNEWKAMRYEDFLYFKIKIRAAMYDADSPLLDRIRQSVEYAEALELLIRVGDDDFMLDAIIHYRTKLNADGDVWYNTNRGVQYLKMLNQFSRNKWLKIKQVLSSHVNPPDSLKSIRLNVDG